MRDIFQPKTEPAKSIYDAFQLEALLRKGRSIEEWIAKEREAVWREATSKAAQMRLHSPTMDEVIAAERSAIGHVDYGAKWAYRIVEAMRVSHPPEERE